ncbi:4-vinyl reductase 4VR [Isosphaera pallida ATCC 43644]|jgi:predicted hydrocarbon binding protein|uniref:4-vinyl reductase 4VR n=1 Tax=Isosphaera pallida (strain ATCC 43644 / DSM 9630 / IS1B) TaxID=575540 RepID=E8R542_ISOPI|nr:V4R domain-containing protein [Isosphaera pallida]ADV62799.1 4-vinyl reductase 4VR [Isosphaera pallida ATCC 43644]
MPNVPEIADPKRLMLVWGEKPNPETLTLVRQAPDAGELRESMRIVKGPQPFKHNHYFDADFFRHDPKGGTLKTVYGQRVIRVTEDFVVAILGSLEEEVGDAAAEIMYKCGYEWGMEDMKSFYARAQAEFEVEINKMSMGFLLEQWWWPLTIEGWGTWRYDFRQAKQGLIFVDLYESAVAKSIGDIGKVVCYFYAGLFAAVFSVLAKRSLGAIEIQCYSTGEDYCKFLISSSKRVNAAAFWRNEGATSKEIQRKVAQMSS